jgi:hypothetical protein
MIGKNNGQVKGFNMGSLFAGASALQQAIALPGAHMAMASGAATRVGLECAWYAPDKWSCMFAGQFAQAAVGVMGLEEHILTALEGRRRVAGVLAGLCDIVDAPNDEAWAESRVIGKLLKLGAITRAPKTGSYIQSTPTELAFYRAWAYQAQHSGANWNKENMRDLGVSQSEVDKFKTPFIWKVPLSDGEMTAAHLDEVVRKMHYAERQLAMLAFAPGGFVIQAASTPDTRKLTPGSRPRGLIQMKSYRPEDGLVYAVRANCTAGRITMEAAIPQVVFGSAVLQEAHLLRGNLEWKGLTAFPIVQEIAEDYLRMFLNGALIKQHFAELVGMLTPAPAQVVLNNMAGNPLLSALMHSVEEEQRSHIGYMADEARQAAAGEAALVAATAVVAPVEAQVETAPVGELEQVAEAKPAAGVGELEEVAAEIEQVASGHMGGDASEDGLAALIDANAPEGAEGEQYEHPTNEEIEEPAEAPAYQEAATAAA